MTRTRCRRAAARRAMLTPVVFTGMIAALTACGISTAVSPSTLGAGERAPSSAASPVDLTPTSTTSVPATAAPAAGQPPTVVTIGDSIMAGWNLDSGDAWPALLAARTHAQVVNDSCNGAGFVAIGDCGTDFSGLLDAAIAADPDIVIIQSSDNDEGYDTDAIRDATTTTVAAIRAALPDAQIVGFSTLYDQPGDIPDDIVIGSIALSDAIDAVGGTFIDLGQPLQDRPDLLQDDGEHPTADGQHVLADTIIAALRDADLGV